jgi:hypothetical protein
MENPSWINAAGRPASLRRTPQHCSGTGGHRGPGVVRAVAPAWASSAGVSGPGLVASRFVITSQPGQVPSRPARRLPW